MFQVEDGPFIVALETTLKDMKVHREAYYGGAFTGNHAHKCLKVINIHLYVLYTVYVQVYKNTHTVHVQQQLCILCTLTWLFTFIL